MPGFGEPFFLRATPTESRDYGISVLLFLLNFLYIGSGSESF